MLLVTSFVVNIYRDSATTLKTDNSLAVSGIVFNRIVLFYVDFHSFFA